MMQPELLDDQLSWPFYDVIDSTFDEGAYHGQSMELVAPLDGYGRFPSILATTGDSSELSSASFSSTIFPSEFVPYQFYTDSQPVMVAMRSDFSTELGILENILNDDEIVGMDYIIEESEGSFSLEQISTEAEDLLCPSPSMISESSPDISSNQPHVTLPGEDMEIDNLLSVYHLLKAHGEAFEKDERELAQVILRRISEKVSPIGESLESVAFYLSQDVENQGDYLKQESCKNFEAAFRAFYQSFPEGKLAHYAANSAILDAMPGVAETIHIVDFHMGEGVQWPPLMEAIAHQHKTLRLTSIKWEEEDAPSPWSFEETKRRLHNQARVLGLKLKVEEMGIEDLVSETRKMQKRDSRREWMVFNCMFSLPHMGRGRSRTLVMEFLKVAKELISSSTNSCGTNNRGIITFGDGDAYDKLKHCSGFGSFFEGYVEHYQALLESLRMNFPPHLLEARIAMECLFVAPYISSLSWLHKWEEMKNSCHPQERLGLEGRKLSQEILAEAKEMVKEGESSYGARIVGQSGNEMVLEWKGITMVKVSIWTNQL